MRTVGVEESAAIGTQFLNHFLRRHRSLGQGLGSVLQGSDRGIGLEILYDTLADQHRRNHQADRQQDPKDDARGIHPEIADRG